MATYAITKNLTTPQISDRKSDSHVKNAETMQKEIYATKTLLTFKLTASVLADWLATGNNMKDSWLGQAEHWLMPAYSNTAYLEKTKPAIMAFLSKWQSFAKTGNYKTAEDIFKNILTNNNDAAEGCRIFKTMINGAINNKSFANHNLGHTHHQAIKNFIASEEIQSAAERSRQILENTNLFLLTNGTSYGAAYAIGQMFSADPQHSELAKAIMDKANLQPGFDQILQVFDFNNPFVLLGSLGIAKVGLVAAKSLFSLPYMESAALHAGAAAIVHSVKTENQEQGLTPSSSNSIPKNHSPIVATTVPNNIQIDGQDIKFNKNSKTPTNNRNKQSELKTIRSALDRPNLIITKKNIPKMKNQTELIKEAQDALVHRETIQDYGKFFIQTELLNDSKAPKVWPATLEQLRTDAKEYSKIISNTSSVPNQIEALRKELYLKYLSIYSRDQALLVGLLNGDGGNCEARAKIVVEAFLASGLKLPADQILGIQVFTNHVQPVIYNKKTGTVADLVSGEISKTVISDIYAPQIFYHSYLKREKAQIPVSEKELLIVKGEPLANSDSPTPIERNYVSNTNLDLPKSSASYGEKGKEIPERAYNSYQSIREAEEKSVSENASGTNTDSDLNQQTNQNTDLQLLKNSNLTDIDGLNFFERDSTLYFANQAQLDHYKKLRTPEAKQSFVQALNRLSLTKVLDTPAYAIAIDLFNNTTHFAQYSQAQIESVTNLYKQISKIIESEPNNNAANGTGDSRQENALSSPALTNLQELEEKYYTKIVKNPKAVISLLDTFSTKKQHEFFEFSNIIETSIVTRTRLEIKLHDVMATFLSDKQKVDFARPEPSISDQKTKKELPEIHPPTVPLSMCKDTKDKSPFYIVCIPPPINKKDIVQPKAETIVTANTMLNLMFELGLKDLANRWSPELSQEFLKINKDGKYDQQFVDNYEQISNKKDKNTAKLITNPYYVKDIPGQTLKAVPFDIAKILQTIKKRGKAVPGQGITYSTTVTYNTNGNATIKTVSSSQQTATITISKSELKEFAKKGDVETKLNDLGAKIQRASQAAITTRQTKITNVTIGNVDEKK